MKVSDLTVERISQPNKPSVPTASREDVVLVVCLGIFVSSVALFISNVFMQFLNEYCTYSLATFIVLLIIYMTTSALKPPKIKVETPKEPDAGEMIQRALREIHTNKNIDYDELVDRVATKLKMWNYNEPIDYKAVRQEVLMFLVTSNFDYTTSTLYDLKLLEPDNLIVNVSSSAFYDTAKEMLNLGISPKRIIELYSTGTITIILNKTDMHLYELSVDLSNNDLSKKSRSLDMDHRLNSVLRTNTFFEFLHTFENNGTFSIGSSGEYGYARIQPVQPMNNSYISTGISGISGAKLNKAIGYVDYNTGQFVMNKAPYFPTFKLIFFRTVGALKSVLKVLDKKTNTNYNGVRNYGEANA